MATYLINNYTAIDFTALSNTNIFSTFFSLLTTTADLNVANGGNFTQDGLVVNNVLGQSWIQQYDGNATRATLSFASTNGLYSISYTGSNIVNNSVNGDGVYSRITYTLPNPENGALVKMTYEGSLTRFTTGVVGSGIINKLIYEVGTLQVELYGAITKTFVPDIGLGNSYDTYTGTINGFNFKDANGQLSITNISPPLDLATFDNLTFDQLDSISRLQSAQRTSGNDTFTDLFNLLDTDTFKGGSDDTVIVNPDTGNTVGGVGSSTNPYFIPNNVENLPLPEGSSDYYAIGNAANNVMTGNSARNFFEGRAGNDTLIGNGGDDNLKGEDGLDILNGGEGNDILDGGAGKDTLTGGNGNDTYILDTALNGKYEDKVVEAKNAGSDTLAYRSAFGVQARPVTLKLIRNFENLDVSLTNTNYNLTGDAGNNVLTGNLQNNVLDGGRGADRLVGGGGADTYILDNAGDVVVEALDAEIDTVSVRFLSDFALIDNGSSNFSNIENAILGHTRALGLTGNALNNTLTGNRAANTINGGDGNDTINGVAGNDTLNGDAGNDTLIGGAGNDTLNGGLGNDTLNGDAGNDTLNGGDADDVLNGGAGNDILNGGAGNDTLSGGRGRDTFDFNDKGTAGNPSVDTVTDFSIRERDVLDLRDLLDIGSNDWTNFIDIALTNGKTEISISSTGNVASSEDAHITINADLFALTKTGTEVDLYNALLNKNLLID